MYKKKFIERLKEDAESKVEGGNGTVITEPISTGTNKIEPNDDQQVTRKSSRSESENDSGQRDTDGADGDSKSKSIKKSGAASTRKPLLARENGGGGFGSKRGSKGKGTEDDRSSDETYKPPSSAEKGSGRRRTTRKNVENRPGSPKQRRTTRSRSNREEVNKMFESSRGWFVCQFCSMSVYEKELTSHLTDNHLPKQDGKSLTDGRGRLKSNVIQNWDPSGCLLCKSFDGPNCDDGEGIFLHYSNVHKVIWRADFEPEDKEEVNLELNRMMFGREKAEGNA